MALSTVTKWVMEKIRSVMDPKVPVSNRHRSNESFNTVNMVISPLAIVQQTKNS